MVVIAREIIRKIIKERYYNIDLTKKFLLKRCVKWW